MLVWRLVIESSVTAYEELPSSVALIGLSVASRSYLPRVWSSGSKDDVKQGNSGVRKVSAKKQEGRFCLWHLEVKSGSVLKFCWRLLYLAARKYVQYPGTTFH